MRGARLGRLNAASRVGRQARRLTAGTWAIKGVVENAFGVPQKTGSDVPCSAEAQRAVLAGHQAEDMGARLAVPLELRVVSSTTGESR
jgi:hypothetical protein